MSWEWIEGVVGGRSLESLRTACARALRELRAQAGDPDNEAAQLRLCVAYPTGLLETVASLPASDSPPAAEPHPDRPVDDAFQDIAVGKGAERITIGRLFADKGTLDKCAESGTTAQLSVLLQLYREELMARAGRHVKTALRSSLEPQVLREHSTLRDVFGSLLQSMVDAFQGYEWICYLRRAYLPTPADGSDWPYRKDCFAYRLTEAALAIADGADWLRFWDAQGSLDHAGEAPEQSSGAWRPDETRGDGEFIGDAFPLLLSEVADWNEPGDARQTVRFYGVLSLLRRPPYGFLAPERTFLSELAEELAVSIRDSATQHELHWHDELVFKLNRAHSANEVMDLAARWFRDLYCPTEIAILRLEGRYLNPVYLRGIERMDIPPLDILSEPGGVKRAARYGRIDYIRDTSLNVNYLQVHNATRSQIAVPLFTGTEVIGVMFLGFPVANAVGLPEAALLRAVSYRVATALWRAERARHASVVSHKLKELLPTFRDQLLAIVKREELTAGARERLEGLMQVVDVWRPRITSLVEAMSADIPGAAQTRFDVVELLQGLVARKSAESASSTGVVVSLEAQAEGRAFVRGWKQAIETALEAIVQNGIEASAKQAAGKVEVFACLKERDSLHAEPPLKCIEIRIRDNGEGIREEVRHRIFEPLFTTKGGSGWGVGLFVARDILGGIGGGIELVANQSEGAEFLVWMPTAG